MSTQGVWEKYYKGIRVLKLNDLLSHDASRIYHFNATPSMILVDTMNKIEYIGHPSLVYIEDKINHMLENKF